MKLVGLMAIILQEVGQGIVERTVSFIYLNGCCEWTAFTRVKKCVTSLKQKQALVES